MRFWEALRHLEKDKKIRKKSWPESEWISNEPSSIQDCHSNLSDLLNGEWEIYTNPAKKYSFLDVTKGMLQGKKYRRPTWRKTRKSIWTWCDNGELMGKLKGIDLIAEDWEEDATE